MLSNSPAERSTQWRGGRWWTLCRVSAVFIRIFRNSWCEVPLEPACLQALAPYSESWGRERPLALSENVLWVGQDDHLRAWLQKEGCRVLLSKGQSCYLQDSLITKQWYAPLSLCDLCVFVLRSGGGRGLRGLLLSLTWPGGRSQWWVLPGAALDFICKVDHC